MRRQETLAERFEANRSHLTGVAYRLLGSPNEAEDAVQEAWLRLSRAETRAVENLRAWLTTVVARVCLDMLRSRRSRREEPLSERVPELVLIRGEGTDPEHEAVLAESIGLALLVVLETLTPAQRVAFVLHDMFDLPFEEIAPIVERSPAAARQLASRARRRVRGAEVPATDLHRQREIVDAFFAAARGGDFSALLAVLAPDVVLRADAAAVQWSTARREAGTPRLARVIRGATTVAQALSGTLQAAERALINGTPALVWIAGGQPRAVMSFTIRHNKIVAIALITDADRIRQLRSSPRTRDPSPHDPAAPGSR
jgi:RNA polymerase sigma factor (sigma-70 family)